MQTFAHKANAVAGHLMPALSVVISQVTVHYKLHIADIADFRRKSFAGYSSNFGANATWKYSDNRRPPSNRNQLNF